MQVSPARLLRVENPNSMQGLWYTEDGQFNPIITKLSHGLAAGYPMGFDPQFRLDGDRWFSACDNTLDMAHWFSDADLQELGQMGYNLYGFRVRQYRVVNGHAAFRREDVLGDPILLPFETLRLH